MYKKLFIFLTLISLNAPGTATALTAKICRFDIFPTFLAKCRDFGSNSPGAPCTLFQIRGEKVFREYQYNEEPSKKCLDSSGQRYRLMYFDPRFRLKQNLKASSALGYPLFERDGKKEK